MIDLKKILGFLLNYTLYTQFYIFINNIIREKHQCSQSIERGFKDDEF